MSNNMIEVVLNGYNYGKCKLNASRYFTKHNNVGLYFSNEKNGVVAVCTTNLDLSELNNDKFVAIKNYSENVGMDKLLVQHGYIKGPIAEKRSGMVFVPIYALTEKGKSLLK